MLEANVDNSKVRAISSSIKLAIKGGISNSSFSFKAMVIITCKASKNNQCSWDRLSTQAFTTRKKKNNNLSDFPS